MKKLDFDLKLKLNGKRLYQTRSAKCLSIKTEGSLTWSKNISDISIKLGRHNVIINKVRKFGTLTVKKNFMSILILIRKKVLRITKNALLVSKMNYENVCSTKFFYNHEIHKFDSPSVFSHWYSFSSDSHRYEASFLQKDS